MEGHWWHDPDANHAFVLSWISVIITMAACIGGLATAKLTGSSLILAYGLENMVDFLSSVVVLWRFYCPSHADPVREAILAKREQRASAAISLILVILGLGIMISAIGHLERGADDNVDEETDTLISIGIPSIFIFGLMAFIKFHYSSMLSSPSLQKDAICSLIGTVLALSLVLNSIIIKSTSKAWWLDPLIALFCGLGSLYVALSSIYADYVVNGIPVLQPRWWIFSEGEATNISPTFNEDEEYGNVNVQKAKNEEPSVKLSRNTHTNTSASNEVDDTEIV